MTKQEDILYQIGMDINRVTSQVDRPVKFVVGNVDKKRWLKGIFKGFGVDWDECSIGIPVQYTVGIIEKESGSILLIPTYNFIFTDKEQS